jgi:hypothetical protein
MTTLPLRRTQRTVVERMRRGVADAFNSKGETPREAVAEEDFLFDMLGLQYIVLEPECRVLPGFGSVSV